MSELSKFINTHCYSVCRELKAGIQMFSWTESICSSVVHERVELMSDTPVDDIDARVVISAHGTSFLLIQAERLCPLSRKHCSDARMAASKMRFQSAICLPTCVDTTT